MERLSLEKINLPLHKMRGIFLIILAAFSFGLIPFFAKTAYNGGFNPFSFSLFRCIFTALTIFIILKKRNKSVAIVKKQILPLFKASFFGYFLMMVTLFSAYNHMATGLATTLHFIYPLATMAGAVVIYKEKASISQVLALFVSLFGIFFLAGVDTNGTITLTGFILALSSGLFYAYYVLIVSHSNVRTLSAMVQIFYITLFNSIFLLIMTLFTGTLMLDISLTGFLASIMVALVSSVFGMVAFQAGLKAVSATSATILSTFEVVTSILIGVIFLAETLSAFQLGGSILIVFSVIWVSLAEKKH